MNFLDESGLKKLWAKIKASFNTAIVNDSDYRNELDNEGHISIPFVANHQIVNMDLSYNINVYDWFQKASKGGILEVVFAGAQGGSTFAITMVIATCIKCKYHHMVHFLIRLHIWQRHGIPMHA